ncbi:MAG: M20/M25/M40 family metallo-hydrolase [Candidatus Methanomethyliaceae archaeon]|nr:M20/M25/M40 family metallo-hydrolase [Candidatus Methanomethyliaceae archaeon]MDW7970274.1 M20/M25/M40 family metallo-hydrolase [Nitrososphaerota archaeon]
MDYELSILKRLVEINTDVTKKSGYYDCALIIKEIMENLGLEVDFFSPKFQDGIPRPSVIGKIDASSKFTIAFFAHYDVVPPGENWSKSPFKLTIEGNKAFGRGASDDKGGIATILGAMRLAKNSTKFNVMVIITPEEEVGGELGLGYLMENYDIKPDFGIIVDSSPNMIGIGASGIIRGEIRVKGRQGHAGYPHLAINPIHELSFIISKFEEFIRFRERKHSIAAAPPGSPKEKVWGRFSFTMIGGGIKENIIPEEAWTKFDMRLIPEEDPEEAKREFFEFLNKINIKGKIIASLDKPDRGYLTNPSNPFVRLFIEATAKVFGSPLPLCASLGGNDGRFLTSKSIPIISYGVIADDTNFHGADEFVYIRDLENVRNVFVEFMRGGMNAPISYYGNNK